MIVKWQLMVRDLARSLQPIDTLDGFHQSGPERHMFTTAGGRVAEGLRGCLVR
jgi:hypothetical protein